MCSCNTILCVDPDLFYNKLDSMKQSFSNTSELTKLHDLSIFWGEDVLNSPTKPIVAKLLFLFLYLYNNIICEIFSVFFFCDYARMLAHLGVRSYGPKHLPSPVLNLVYTPG